MAVEEKEKVAKALEEREVCCCVSDGVVLCLTVCCCVSVVV